MLELTKGRSEKIHQLKGSSSIQWNRGKKGGGAEDSDLLIVGKVLFGEKNGFTLLRGLKRRRKIEGLSLLDKKFWCLRSTAGKGGRKFNDGAARKRVSKGVF